MPTKCARCNQSMAAAYAKLDNGPFYIDKTMTEKSD